MRVLQVCPYRDDWVTYPTWRDTVTCPGCGLSAGILGGRQTPRAEPIRVFVTGHLAMAPRPAWAGWVNYVDFDMWSDYEPTQNNVDREVD